MDCSKIDNLPLQLRKGYQARRDNVSGRLFVERGDREGTIDAIASIALWGRETLKTVYGNQWWLSAYHHSRRPEDSLDDLSVLHCPGLGRGSTSKPFTIDPTLPAM